jgi:hypothetical protein
MSITKEMVQALKEEAKKRKIGSIQETMRAILGEYFMLRGEKESRQKKERTRYVPNLEPRNPLAH